MDGNECRCFPTGAAASDGRDGFGGPERSRSARPARVWFKGRKAGKAPGSFHVSSLPMAWFASWSFLAWRLKRAAKHCTLRGGNFRRFRSQFAVNLQSTPILIRRVTYGILKPTTIFLQKFRKSSTQSIIFDIIENKIH